MVAAVPAGVPEILEVREFLSTRQPFFPLGRSGLCHIMPGSDDFHPRVVPRSAKARRVRPWIKAVSTLRRRWQAAVPMLARSCIPMLAQTLVQTLRQGLAGTFHRSIHGLPNSGYSRARWIQSSARRAESGAAGDEG